MGLPRTPLTHYLCVFHSMSSSLSLTLNTLMRSTWTLHVSQNWMNWTRQGTNTHRRISRHFWPNLCECMYPQSTLLLFYQVPETEDDVAVQLGPYTLNTLRCWSVSVCNNLMEVRRRVAWNLFTCDGFGPVLWRVKSSSSIVLLTTTVHSEDMWYGMGIDVRFIWRESLN